MTVSAPAAITTIIPAPAATTTIPVPPSAAIIAGYGGEVGNLAKTYEDKMKYVGVMDI
jgi:hypothetical protein